MKKGKNGNLLPSLDMLFDGVLMDIKSITKLKGHYGAALTSKNKQLNKFNARSDVRVKADTVCLYFHDGDMFSKKRIMDGVDYLRDNAKNVVIKHIVCAIRTKEGIKIIQYDI